MKVQNFIFLFFTSLCLFTSGCSSKETVAASIPQFGIKFYILTENSDANRIFEKKRVIKVLENLQKNFRDDSGNKLVHFKFEGLAFYKDLKESDCDLLKYGTQNKKPNKLKMIKGYTSCQDPSVRNDKLINFYIFDSPWQKHEKWKTSYSYFDGTTGPAILANWETLKSGYKAPDVHEMGHIFSLKHTLACGSNDSTPTYSMASESTSCKGTGGNRALGFSEDEFAIIKSSAQKIERTLSKNRLF